MDAAQLLGYIESPNFLRAEEDFPGSQELGYVLRKAREECGLKGVYVLRNADDSSALVPVVYFCQADTEAKARQIHKCVWNQGIVPFVLVQTPQYLRLYSGFLYQQATSHETEDRGILKPAVAFNEVLAQLAAFQAEAIDNGTLWQEWGDRITPETRVDWRLLGQLEKLDAYLQQQNVGRDLSHALIGKFVYFRYLRDRQFLSDRKLAEWNIAPRSIFSRDATLEGLLSLDSRTHEWLNGDIFPLDAAALSSVPSLLLQQVAGVFSGDTVEGQLHLDFEPYDFSFIPIETLSVIYEQFLHLPTGDQSPSQGRKVGAYYTPIPLITFILEELEKKRPLTKGMRILDPACGSGAFLVQCYRRLIEKRRRQTQKPLQPGELRDILTSQLFGVERDGDACRVAELSLILTLLDYVSLSEQESNSSFQLPCLRGTNIFEADFFAPDSTWTRAASTKKFDWVVGNPPWVSLSSQRIGQEDRYVWQWMKTNSREAPTGGNQVAEAFVWKMLPHLAQDGVAGFVLPVMTLFKKESTRFRQKFFVTVRTWCVANFANLADVLFTKRARRPALALFFQLRSNGCFEGGQDETILTYAPLVMNQEANRPHEAGKQQDTWNITVNAAEIQEVPTYKAATGDMLPWKLAMWGCFRDGKLLERITRKFPAFYDFAKSHDIVAHQGFELRKKAAQSRELLEARPELAGKKCVHFMKLRGSGRIFAFPESAIDTLPEELTYVRKGRSELPMRVSTPPHILVDEGRRFAVYSEEFIAVSARQIGIASASGKESLLKALSLYLSSDFVTYQQFFTTPQWGISTSIATLDSLKNLPIPLDNLSQKDLNEWASLRDSLAESAVQEQQTLADKIAELNERVYCLLGLREADRILVHDFVTTTMQCIKGKVTKKVLASPSKLIMQSHVQRLQRELDAFIDGRPDMHHEITALHDPHSAMLAIRLIQRGTPPSPIIRPADAETTLEFAQIRERLQQRHSQWLYFNRNLRVYDRDVVYCFKPMQALHWTQRQAILDASEVIAETLVVEE